MTAPLNIFHVLTSFHIGGGERVAVDLAKRQHAQGHRVTVVSLEAPPDGPLSGELTRAGIRVRRVVKRPRGLDPTLTARLVALFVRQRADVVHTHNPLPLIYAALAGRLARARVIHTKHGANAASSRSRALRRRASAFVHHFVAVSEETAVQAREQRDSSPARISVVRNGIDLSRFGPDAVSRADVRDELGIAQDAWVVGSVGRLISLKNHQLLLRAAEPLLGPSFHLVIVGDGPTMESLVELRAASAAPESIHLLGVRRDVPRLLTCFDAFAMSSDSEGLPLVVPEAMATGLPIVCTAVGGLPAVVDEDQTGYLVPAGDEDGLRDRMKRLAGDVSHAQDLGRRARDVALQRYSAERMVADYAELYHR